MSLRINQNISAFSAHRFMSANDASMSKSIERLSSGLRINSAADDAAGLAISEQLRTQVSGISVATRNTQDGINMIKTAEAALNEVEAQLRNMRDLTLHAINANGNAQMLAADQAQFQQASEAIDRIANQTEFAGRKLLAAGAGNNIDDLVFQIGANSGQTATFDVTGVTFDSATVKADMTTAATGLNISTGTGTAASNTMSVATAATVTAEETITVTGALGSASVVMAAASTRAEVVADINAETTNTGVKVTLTKSDGTISAFSAENTYLTFSASNAAGTAEATGTTISVISNQATGNGTGIGTVAHQSTGTAAGIDLTSTTSGVMDKLDTALKMVNGLRVNLGAFQKNNLESNLASLAVAKENTAASESAIRDTDMAAEMVSFTRSQILTQAAQAMLTQANQAPQSILQMLR